MIPWVIALFLSFSAGFLTPDHASEGLYDVSGGTEISQADGDSQGSARPSAPPLKLPAIACVAVGLPRQPCLLLPVEEDGGCLLGQMMRRREHGRAPPVSAVV
jgi:hypothetical protein